MPEPPQDLVGVQQPQRPEDAQESQALAGDRREERGDRHDVGQRRRIAQISHPVRRDRHPRREVGEDHDPEDRVDDLDGPTVRVNEVAIT